MTNFNTPYLKYLSYIKYLVIDEIDRLIELGLFKEISQIFRKINLKEINREQNDVEVEEEYVEFNNKKIKAAGGIKDFADAEKFIELGADRLGTSRLVKQMKEDA